jgi:hypothetical protein
VSAGTELTPDQKERLIRAYADLMELATFTTVPGVRAAARAALAHISQALNAQGIQYDLYSSRLPID